MKWEEKQDDVIALYYQGKSNQEIANDTGIPLGSITRVVSLLISKSTNDAASRLNQIKVIENRLFKAIENKEPENIIEDLQHSYSTFLLT